MTRSLLCNYIFSLGDNPRAPAAAATLLQVSVEKCLAKLQKTPALRLRVIMTFTRLTFPALEFDPPDELAAHQQIESTFMQRAHMYIRTRTCILTTAHTTVSLTHTQMLFFEEDIHIIFIGRPCVLLKYMQSVVYNFPFKL